MLVAVVSCPGLRVPGRRGGWHTGVMTSGELQQIHDTDFAVPAHRHLSDVTAELTRALGDPDPAVRDALVLPVLGTWLERGVYDDLLVGLGDGMAVGLSSGLGEVGTTSVFRRSSSALVLGWCIERDTEMLLVPSGKVMEWGDRLSTWLLAEQDTRGWVPGSGWAHAVAHGADALGALAGSPHLGREELPVVLDVLGELVGRRCERMLGAGEPDRLAAATLRALRRDLIGPDQLEAWVARLVAAAASLSPDPAPVEPARGRHAGSAPDPSPIPIPTRSWPVRRSSPTCGRCTCSWRWPRTPRRCAPTCSCCWSTRCAAPTRATSRRTPSPRTSRRDSHPHEPLDVGSLRT